ncbi:MAG: hypothetical protein KA714_13475 [Limnoraphis sp. WC205]|jgi:hypothetical protein|nr:hypothetical protein [Limnoraphis sp. WC205]
MIIKVDIDEREFIINTDAISCIVPQVDDETYLIEFRSGGHYPITYREFTQIAEKIEQEQRTGT